MSNINFNQKAIDKVYFSRGLMNLPKFSIVQDGKEVPVFAETNAIEKMKSDPSYRVAMAISVELMRFGKILSPQAFYGILNLGHERQVELAESLKEYFRDLYMDGKYNTLFGDFPNTVLEMTEGEMLAHQIVHYWATALGGEYWPEHKANDAETRDFPLLDCVLSACCKDKYEVIDAASADELADNLAVLLKSQQSLTLIDKATIATFYNNIDGFTLSPKKKLEMKTIEIPFKETLCIVAAACPDAQVLKEINDVLRVAMFLSNGDVTLSPIPKVKDLGWKKMKLDKEDKKAWNFKNFSNPQTRMLLSSIDAIVAEKGENAIKDMKKYLLRWIRLGEKLHPQSSKNEKKYPHAAEAFDILRNNADSVKTFGSQIESAKKSHNLDAILNLLSKRPGEFARSLDWLLRTFIEDDFFQKKKATNRAKILGGFGDAIEGVSTKLLYELLDHFNKRKEEAFSRKVFIKGARKPVDIPILEPLSEDIVKNIQGVVLSELIKRMSEKEDASGKTVYLEDSLIDIKLPKNMRSTGEAVKQVARGTKLPLPATSNLLRLFLFWVDKNGSEDLDLTVHFYDEAFNYSDTISWNRDYKLFTKKGNDQYAQFSGDVRHHKGNCAEYVDIDIEKALEDGNRYVIAVARDFNAHSFNTAFTGVMARSKWGTPGEVTWAPSTVEQGFKISSTTQNVVLCVVDLKERQIINVDEDLIGCPAYGTVSPSSAMDMIYSDVLERYVNNKDFFTTLSLLETYYNACGATVIVASKEVIEQTKKENEATVTSYKRLLGNTEISESDHETLRNEIKNIEDNTMFFEFSDFAEDYSKVLSYMF